MKKTDRRTLLQRACGGLAVTALPFGLPSLAAAQPNGSSLGGGLHVLDGGGSNVLVFDTGDGLLLVDSGAPGHRDALLQDLGRISGKGVRTLFNTHWHRDQCGANAALGQAGAEIIAHAKTRHRLSTDYYLPHEEVYLRALPEAGRPAESFQHQGSRQAGGQRIDYGYLLQAHTDGDIFVYFRDANVLAVGDAASPALDPELDWYGGGWLGGRVDALDLLLAMSDRDTRFVPAHGPVVGRAQVLAERDMLAQVYERLLDLLTAGCGADCMLEEGALEGLGREWDDPMKFLYAAYKGLWGHHSTLERNII